ncbi:MAG: hypothetical protein V1846_04450 [Candidatus Komeilibacteria bacterium]
MQRPTQPAPVSAAVAVNSVTVTRNDFLDFTPGKLFLTTDSMVVEYRPSWSNLKTGNIEYQGHHTAPMLCPLGQVDTRFIAVYKKGEPGWIWAAERYFAQ